MLRLECGPASLAVSPVEGGGTVIAIVYCRYECASHRVLPAVLCGSEGWSVTLREEHRLRVGVRELGAQEDLGTYWRIILKWI